jgi:hypothetical protein
MTDRTEEHLARGLRSRADTLTEAPLTLAEVKATARTIRRRRRAGAGAAAALVAAVLLPLGLDLSGDDTAVVPAPQPAVAPAGWVTDGTVHLLDGTEVRLEGVTGVRAWASLADGYVAAGTRQGAQVVSLHDADGSLETTWPVTGPAAFVVDGDGRHAAWVLPTGEPVLLDGASGEIERLPSAGLGRRPQVRGIAGSCPADCGVVVAGGPSVGSGWGSTYLVPVHGPVEPFVPEVPRVVALASDDSLVAGIVGPAPDDIHACGGVWLARSGGSARPAWEDCVDNVYRFSPDGRYVATSFAEGAGMRELRLKDAATGVLLHEMPIADAVDRVAWTDEQHVLAAVLRDGRWSVVRIGIDGQEEVLGGPLPPVPGDIAEVSSPYLLPTGP